MNEIGINTNMMDTLSSNSALLQMLAGIGAVMNIIILITFLLKAWGLYNINKKLGEKHAWLAWIPVVQIYSLFTASRKSWITYLLYPVIAIIAGLLLSMFTFGISILIAILYAAIMGVKLLNAISKRTGRGAWTTLGFIFIPYIMYPIVGYKLKKNSDTEIEVEENIEGTIKEEKIEEKVEL